MKIVVTGSGGRLGAALVREYSKRFHVTGFTRAQLDLADSDQLHRSLGQAEFDVLINAAAFTNVDQAEKEPEQAFKVNAEGPRVLAELCRARNARLIHVSTDYVFDGTKKEPYREDDEARPIGVYGQSKRAGEEAVLSVSHQHLVVRVSWVFGPDRPSFVDQMIDRARDNETIAAVGDKVSTPSYTRDIAAMLLPAVDAGMDGNAGHSEVSTGGTDPGYSGILHVANTGQCTWQEYAQEAVDCCHRVGIPLKTRQVGAIKLSDMKTWIARRPVHTVLSTEKYQGLSGVSPRPWREAVAEYVREFIAPKYQGPGAAI
ncbi:MAG: dTDP-4-dehydrorhamnose reductase [Chthoniobacterales bacterium]